MMLQQHQISYGVSFRMADAEALISEREIEVLRLVATGATNQEIARELVISVNTVKVHLRNIFEKLGVQSRTEATLYAIRQGWVEVNGVEAAAAEPSGGLVAEPDISERIVEPLAWWQRVYVLAALSLALILLVLPLLWREESALAAANPISDRPVTSPTGTRAETSRWSQLADLPNPRTRLALAVRDDQLFAIGGDQETGVSDLVEIYSFETDTWSSGSPKPTPVSNVGAVVVGGRIYVPGGCVGVDQATDQVEVYDPTDDAWTQVASLPMPLCAYALATVDEVIFVFGGWDGQGFVDRVFAYDPGIDVWTELDPMPSAIGFAAAGTIGETIFVVGGYDGVHESANTYAYEIASDTWSVRAPMSIGRGGLGVAVVSDKLYAIGGGWESYLATNERYDPVIDAWTAFESPVLGEWRNLGVTASDTHIYAVGGWNGGYTGTNESYQAIFRVLLPVAQ
jgi:DNA-binding CsgD family transcriptional regulator/N-acetylneuraminic acid mutarotase